ncbi:uncharacterized protein LOC118299797 isoform X1 [Scophthalmus maximus]|uniref:uncharacterized protein LOC118299797 isoform X1 n=1 Tax=Scophthalmus maximus TaxID=52904 RepID=UPI0015E1042E|nr:uncharacterized protein LOC118299797 isoform X1 [Scophthalmus maximus]
MTTKRLKITKLPSREELQKCLSKAAIAIPQLLDELEEDFTNQKRFLFYGYQCAYWSCLFGQRPGVFANMTDKEVEEAKTLSQDRGYLLHIKEHKTNKTFGEAQLFLKREEFAWLERWLAIKKRVPSKESNQFVLFTKRKGPSKNLNNNLQSVWKDMGMVGLINFMIIRSGYLRQKVTRPKGPEEGGRFYVSRHKNCGSILCGQP